MKKLIALILAVLLLGSAAACAESTAVLDLKDPLLDLTVFGESVTIDLAGLTLRFGLYGEEHDPTLGLNILGDDELLYAASVRVEDGRALLAADGLSHSYAFAMPGAQMVGEADESTNEEMATLGAELMGKIMAAAEIGMEGDRITFRLPYTAVNDLLRELLPMLDNVPNVSVTDAEELLQELDEMEERGDGFELSGSLGMSDGFAASLVVTPVEGGVTADEPAFLLDAAMTPNAEGADFELTLRVPSEGSEPVFRAAGSFRRGETAVTLHVDVFAGAEAVSAGAPSAVLDLSAGDDLLLELTLPDAFRFALSFTSADGVLTLAVETESFTAQLTMQAVTGDGELQPCDFPADVIEFSGELSEEESSALLQELMTGFAPVLNFVMPRLVSSGVMG